MKRAAPEKFDLHVCPQCQPAGRNDNACVQCKGVYSGIVHDDVLLYWGIQLTGEEIRFRHSIMRIGRYLTMTLMVLVALAVVYLAYSVRENPFVVFDASFWSGSNQALPVFWFGVLLFFYMLMRVIRREKKYDPIISKSFWEDKKELGAKSTPTPLNPWAPGALKQYAHKQDISKSFSRDALLALERAYYLSESINTERVDNYHILVALLSFDEIMGILVRLGISAHHIKDFAARYASPDTAQGKLPVYDDESMRTAFSAYLEAKKHHMHLVGLGELLWSIYAANEHLQDYLYDIGVDARQMENVIAWVRIKQKMRTQWKRQRVAAKHRPKGGMDKAMTAVATPFLNAVSQDLTILAAYGRVSPLVGREAELESLFRTLQGGKQSVLLVGESGVGKEAIIEGLALFMAEDDVPPVLRDKRLVQLSVPQLLAGATPAVAQQRMLQVIQEVRRARNIILYIPNVENLIGITEGGEGSLDVASVLSRELSQGGFLMFGTTTSESYRRFISNTSLAHAFSKVDIEEMSVDQAIQVLEAKAGYIEYEHKVWFSYAAIEQAAMMSGKFIQDDRLPRKAIRIAKEAAEAAASRGKNVLVTHQDVAKIVSEKSKIPVSAVGENESDKLLRLEEKLHERVVGQTEAVAVVSQALRRARAQLSSGKRTIANFLFLGPTGVGKTELSKTVADAYFGGESQMIRLDMSEFQDDSSFVRMIGSPGKKGTGVLTEAIREKPFALLLLDELEKANPKVLNLFLQLMDDGRITDSLGRTIDATNIMLVATANAGTEYVQKQLDAGVSYEDLQEELLRGKLAEWFRPEFLNRFDAIVLFRALKQEEIHKIAQLMLKRVAKKLDEQGMVLAVDDDVVEDLAKAGFDPQFGARPMRRTIQDRVENQIAELILAKKVSRGDTIHFSKDGVNIE